MSEERPYHPRGDVIERFARRAGIRRKVFKAIADYMERRSEELGLDPEPLRGRQTVANYMYGDSDPSPEWMERFAIVFELDRKKRAELAYASYFPEPAAA